MRELTYYIAVSLDGRVSGPDDDFSMFPTEGDHIDMILREYTDTLPGIGIDALGLAADRSRFDTVLMGWNTYAAGFPFGVTDPYPHLRQHVFSTRDRDVPANITLVRDNAVDRVRRLKAEDGSGIWLCGGGKLASALAGEIDRLVLKVNPIVIGAGPTLFDGAAPGHLTLRDTVRYESGVLINEYSVGA